MPVKFDCFSDDPNAIPRYAGKPASFSFHRTFEPIAPKDYVLDGLLAKGEVSCWFGEPGATKSAVVTDIACHVAGGIPWMGRNAGMRMGAHTYPDGETAPEEWFPTSVLYVALERGPQVQRRIEAFTDEHDLQEPLKIAIWNGPLDFVNDDSDRLTQIVQQVEDASWQVEQAAGADGFGIDLIVIDTLARTFGSGSDSGGEETAAVARHLERTLKFTGAHIALVHHTPIGDDSRLRGHGNLLAAFDMTVRVQKKAAGSLATVLKDNDTAEADKPSFAYTLKSRVIHTDETGRETSAPVVVPADAQTEAKLKRQALPKAKAEAKPIGPSKAEQAAYDALEQAGGPISEAEWRATYDAAKEEDIKPATHRMRFSRSKKDLESKGLIQKSEGGLWSVTTECNETA
jgi:RecA-family ATPase